jgi:hypothetical protein
MKCSRCQRPMHKIDRRDEMVDLDDSATDGQMADYIAAELSGDNGAWNLGSRINHMYLEAVWSNDALAQFWNAVIRELKQKPLHNNSADPDYPVIDKWWNSTEDKPNTDSSLSEGCVLSLKDWPNMVEYWYSVRNNLFHGGKNPNVGRDAFLVEHAFQTLRPLMNIELSNL